MEANPQHFVSMFYQWEIKTGGIFPPTQDWEFKSSIQVAANKAKVDQEL